jgi:hypothetical protein
MSYEALKSILNKGPSRASLYSVRIPNKFGTKENQHMNFLCDAVSVPGTRFNTAVALGQEFMGTQRDMPTALIYSKPLTMSVIESRDYIIYKALKRWNEQICRNANQPGVTGGNGRSHRMNYYNEYVTDIEIVKFEYANRSKILSGSLREPDDCYDEVMKWTFINAWPTEIGPLQYSSMPDAPPVSFDIQFTYESYNIR